MPIATTARLGAPIRPGERGVGEQCAVVGDHRLSEQARENQQQAVEESVLVEPAWRLHLRQQVAGPLNRTGDQVGKQADEQGVVDERFGRLELSLIDVDDVSDFLERVKGYAWRQKNSQHRDRRLMKPHRLESRRERIHEEVEVFEKSEETEVDDERE